MGSMNKTGHMNSTAYKKHILKENPAYGFASTAQRFSYMKEM